MENIRDKTITGFFWQLLQKTSCQLIGFGVSVMLARLLSPGEYGVVAICSMFLVFVGIFIEGGLGTALIQMKDTDETDFSTVFYTGITLSIIVYILVFFAAPYTALLFNNQQITLVIRILALTMPIGALAVVQNAFVQKQMAFRKFFVSSLCGTILSGIIGLTMALLDFGIWALVAQSIANTITNTIVLFLIIDWHPQFTFSYKRFKILFSFGWKMTLINLLTTFLYQLKGYVIGYKYSAASLAYYNRGEGLPGILYNNISGTINTVLFPALSKLQEDKTAVKNALSRSMRITSFFLMPALLGLAALSDKLVLIIFTEKWAPAIPFMQVICLISCSDILGMANYQAIKAIGKINTLLKIEIYKRPLMFAILIISMFISPLAIAIGQLIYSIFAFIINAYPNRKYISYPIFEQLKDVGRSFLTSVIMAIIIYLFGRYNMNIYLCLCVQILLGTTIYVFLAWIFNKEDLNYVTAFIKNKLK